MVQPFPWRQEAPGTSPPATYAEVMSGPQGGNGARNSVAAVQSVDRALSVLEILAAHGEAGVTEVAAELGVHKSTAFRLVGVLESRGFVEQLADRGKYRLGFGVVRLAGAAAAQLDIAREGRPICDALAADLEETVNIAILDGDRAVNVSQARGPGARSEEHTSELQSRQYLVCRLLLEKKKKGDRAFPYYRRQAS